jgi:hypothetical protein
MHIPPGKPKQNGSCESFNDKLPKRGLRVSCSMFEGKLSGRSRGKVAGCTRLKDAAYLQSVEQPAISLAAFRMVSNRGKLYSRTYPFSPTRNKIRPTPVSRRQM